MEVEYEEKVYDVKAVVSVVVSFLLFLYLLAEGEALVLAGASVWGRLLEALAGCGLIFLAFNMALEEALEYAKTGVILLSALSSCLIVCLAGFFTLSAVKCFSEWTSAAAFFSDLGTCCRESGWIILPILYLYVIGFYSIARFMQKFQRRDDDFSDEEEEDIDSDEDELCRGYITDEWPDDSESVREDDFSETQGKEVNRK